MRTRRIIVGLLTGLAVGLAISSALVRAQADGRKGLDEAFVRPVAWLATQVDLRYVEAVDLKDLVAGTCQGMLAEVDPYSAYWPPEMLQELQAGDGRVGPGFEVRFDPVSKAAFVDACLPGTSAFAEGLLPGDLVIELAESRPETEEALSEEMTAEDGVDTDEESTDGVLKVTEMETVYDVFRALRGQPGTELTVAVLRVDESRKLEVTVRRPGPEAPPAVLAAEMVEADPRIGYVYFGHFGQGSADQLERSLDELRAEGMAGLVLDLRYNPGGRDREARAVSGLFLDGEPIAVIRGRRGPETVLRTRRGGADVDLPIVVLVNRFTAGWAELVAAALQDHQRAALVGEKTYGKAGIQTLMPSPFDEGTIRLTCARYYSPEGRTVDGEGVEPDVKVELSHEDTRRLALHLVGAEQAVAAESPAGQAEEGGAAADDQTAEDAEEPFRDTQLERAIELLSAELTQVREEVVPAAAG